MTTHTAGRGPALPACTARGRRLHVAVSPHKIDLVEPSPFSETPPGFSNRGAPSSFEDDSAPPAPHRANARRISVTSYFFYLTTPRCDSLHGPDGGL